VLASAEPHRRKKTQKNEDTQKRRKNIAKNKDQTDEARASNSKVAATGDSANTRRANIFSYKRLTLHNKVFATSTSL